MSICSTIGNMMQLTHKHFGQKQPTLGTVAYWSVTCAPMFNNDSRSEINVGFREGWDG